MLKRRQDQEEEVRRNMRGGPGEIRIRHYFKPGEISARARLCAELVIPPGAGVGLHDHCGEDEIFIIQKGEGRMTDGGREIRVESGDAVLTGKGAAHSILNTGTEDLIVTAVIMQY